MDSQPQSPRQDDAEENAIGRAMVLRRSFLIFVAPVILLSTVFSLQFWWDWFRKLIP